MFPEPPFTRSKAETFALQVPAEDWSRLRAGQCSEFRTIPRSGATHGRVNAPTCVVLYCGDQSELWQLIGERYEPLFAVAEDDTALRHSGFESYDHFRRWWKSNHGGRYSPLMMVSVWRLRRFQDADIVMDGARLLRKLYGPWLPPERRLARGHI